LDNYKYIAMNVAQIYHLLSTDYAYLFKEEKVLLKTCGVIDTILYLQEGTITIEGIDNAILIASHGKCALPLAEETHESKKDVTEAGLFFGVQQVDDLLLNFTMQLECQIFRAESSFSISDEVIIKSVISKKKVIKKTIDETIKKATSGTIDPNIKVLVNAFISNPEYLSLRELIGL
jgi:hypothetical protein